MSEQLSDLFKHTRERYPELLYTHKTIDKDHGRLEQREIFVLDTHATGLKIPGVMQVAELRREREVFCTGSNSKELIYLLTNLRFERVDAKSFMGLKRDYWAIENKLHYRKDFVFGEDRSTIRARYGPQNMSALRNFAVGLLMANGITNVKRCVDNLKHDTSTLIRNAA